MMFVKMVEYLDESVFFYSIENKMSVVFGKWTMT